MKTITLIFLILFFNSLLTFSQNVGDTLVSNNPTITKVKVFYFHITDRCHTCTSIEENLRKTLLGNFKNEIDSGIIDLQILNCEKIENVPLVKKYEAYGSTLALTKIENGAEVKIDDITNFAFSKIHDESVFISELKLKIQELLKP